MDGLRSLSHEPRRLPGPHHVAQVRTKDVGPQVEQFGIHQHIEGAAGETTVQDRAADIAARLLRQAIRNALFSAGATVKIDAELLSAARERLWDASEQDFYATLERVADGAERADALARPILEQVFEITGMIRSRRK